MLVIIHGWSDTSGSFKQLAKKLARPAPEGIGAKVVQIHLGDYVSLDDQVTFRDLVEAMDKAWKERGLPTGSRRVDAIVHSTGGLIIRDWITHFFTPDTVPIRRLLMLAPANFGSPLAHTGRSIIGRAFKGWKGERLFETGTHILKGLELGSTYSWALAERDLFGGRLYYGPGRILCTVLVGNTGYTGISAVANKPGTDGTVRVSTANLNAARMELDFSAGPQAPDKTAKKLDDRRIAFGVADNEDHSSITAKGRGGVREAVTWELIRKALLVTDAGYDDWRKQLQEHTDKVTDAAEKRKGLHYNSYQNTVVRVMDDHGAFIRDYMVELYVNDDRTVREKRLTSRIQEHAITNVHAYSDNKSYRSMLIDCTLLYDILSDRDDRLNISITASPNIGKSNVGYKTYTDKDIGQLSLDPDQVKRLFSPHRTLLLTLILKRFQKDKVFRFKDA